MASAATICPCSCDQQLSERHRLFRSAMHTSSCLGSGLTLPGRHTFPRQHTRQGHCYAARMKALSREEALALLELDRGSSKAELRAAYLERIRQLHPDVNLSEDTTKEAARLNEAYSILQQAFDGPQAVQFRDVFDEPEEEPQYVFINPFACNVDPFMWRELQECALSASDPQEALAAQGVYLRDSAIYYLTGRQLAAIRADLEAMEESVSVELTSWFVGDCLMRAARANSRMPSLDQ